MKEKVRMKVPASVSNLGPGFDILGAAIDLYNIIEIGIDSSFKIEVEGRDADKIPLNEKNICWQAMKIVFKKVGFSEEKVYLRMNNSIPVGKGLGSSAAARVGGIIGANLLLGGPLSENEIIEIAISLEGHPDNVIPCIKGGMNLIFKDDKFCWQPLPWPIQWGFVICVPEIEVSTDEARKILPTQISLEDGIFNLSRIGLLILAIYEKKKELLSIATQDRFHQQYREKFIPGFKKIKEKAMKNKALGVVISGSGSTIIAIFDKKETSGEEIGEVMTKEFKKSGILADYLILGVENKGIQVI